MVRAQLRRSRTGSGMAAVESRTRQRANTCGRHHRQRAGDARPSPCETRTGASGCQRAAGDARGSDPGAADACAARAGGSLGAVSGSAGFDHADDLQGWRVDRRLGTARGGRRMKLVIFGLSISSSWGNGHATLWRGLYAALIQLGHRVVFFEHDAPWYAQARDWNAPAGGLVLYPDWPSIHAQAERELADADAAIVTSYCADALAAREAMLEAPRPLRVFYDLDSPVTLNTLASGEAVPWLDERGLRDYELVLSYAGGPALRELERVLGARRTAALYGHVDPDVHSPAPPQDHYRADLSWIGTYAADRQPALEELFVKDRKSVV